MSGRAFANILFAKSLQEQSPGLAGTTELSPAAEGLGHPLLNLAAPQKAHPGCHMGIFFKMPGAPCETLLLFFLSEGDFLHITFSKGGEREPVGSNKYFLGICHMPATILHTPRELAHFILISRQPDKVRIVLPSLYRKGN